MKQSFSWWSFVGRGVEDKMLLQAAKAIGYSGVDLIDPANYDLAIDCGLSIAAINGHNSISSGFNDESQHDRIEREIESNLAIATKYGIPNLIVFSGNRRNEESDEQGAQATAAGVQKVIKAASDAKVTLVMELLNSKVDHSGYQCDRTKWLVDIVKQVGSPNFKALYDIYHMQIMEGDLIRTIRENAEFIGHYHTAGNPGRNEIDDTQEINYAAVFSAIARTDYSGYIAHELIPATDPVNALRVAFSLCEISSR